MSQLNNFLRRFYNRFFSQDPLADLVERGLVVGKNFNMQNEVLIDRNHCWHITIGDDVTLAPRVYILAHDASTKRQLGYTKIGKVRIGNRVFVGAASVIMPGVNIGDDVIIGVGSVVTGDIPDGSLAVGVPAKVIGTVEEYMAKRKREIDSLPCFGEEYTERKQVTDAMKSEMNEKMIDGFGFVD